MDFLAVQARYFASGFFDQDLPGANIPIVELGVVIDIQIGLAACDQRHFDAR